MFTSFSRRQLFSLIGFIVTGTVVAGSTPFLGNFFASIAQAKETSEFVYKGRKYKIVTLLKPDRNSPVDNTFDTDEQLFLDGHNINIARNKETQTYLTPLLFGQYNSPHEVARSLIDQGIKFPTGEVKLDPNVD